MHCRLSVEITAFADTVVQENGKTKTKEENEMDYIIFMILLLPTIFVLFYTGYDFVLVYSGVIWGIRIETSPTQKRRKALHLTLFILALIIWNILIIPAITGFFVLIFEYGLIATLLYCLSAVAVIFLAAFTAKRNAEKRMSSGKETNAAVLGTLPFVKAVENNLPEASCFIVSFEGIALMNTMNYCFALVRYTDFGLGSLTSPREVALIGMYFVQKYGNQFDFKVDMAEIPGTPGKTIVVYGSGGIHTAYVGGTSGTRIFRSYIFTRKQEH